MRNPFMDKHRNSTGQQKLFDITPIPSAKKEVIVRNIPINIEDYKIEYCLTSKGMDPKSMNLTTRNKKIIELIKDGKTSANVLLPHFKDHKAITVNTIAVELRYLENEQLISRLNG